MEAAAVTPETPQVMSGHDQPRILRPLAIAAMAALGLVTIANLLALWADVLQLGIANDLQGGRRVPFDDLTASDDRVTTTGLLQSGCYLVCIVAFLAWYGRAYRNLRRLGVHELRWGQGWAIAYWFIPIANLFRPKQVVNDIWRASDPDLPAGNWWDRRVPALIHFWWAAWLISTFFERTFFHRHHPGAARGARRAKHHKAAGGAPPAVRERRARRAAPGARRGHVGAAADPDGRRAAADAVRAARAPDLSPWPSRSGPRHAPGCGRAARRQPRRTRAAPPPAARAR
jgi:hypothetical protein